MNQSGRLVSAAILGVLAILSGADHAAAGQQPSPPVQTPPRAQSPPGQQPPPAGQSPSAAQAQTPPSSQESANELFVTVGKSVIVNSSVPIARISVGYGDAAEANAVSPTEVLVNGKAPGETSLIIWQEGHQKLFFDVTFSQADIALPARADQIRRQISTELPGEKIDVSVENDLIFLRGTAKDLDQRRPGPCDCQLRRKSRQSAVCRCARVGSANFAEGSFCERRPQLEQDARIQPFQHWRDEHTGDCQHAAVLSSGYK